MSLQPLLNLSNNRISCVREPQCQKLPSSITTWETCILHARASRKAGAATIITDAVEDLERADAIVLPGVGAFDPAMQHLRQQNLIEPIRRIIESGKPYFMHLFGLTGTF